MKKWQLESGQAVLGGGVLYGETERSSDRFSIDKRAISWRPIDQFTLLQSTTHLEDHEPVAIDAK